MSVDAVTVRTFCTVSCPARTARQTRNQGHGVHYANRAGETDTIPAERAAVVDTTAAGDTFVGQYALEVVLTPPGARFDMAAAVKKANRAAAKTVERKGAQDSIPWRDELSP